MTELVRAASAGELRTIISGDHTEEEEQPVATTAPASLEIARRRLELLRRPAWQR